MHRTILVSAREGRPQLDALAAAVGLARPRGAQLIVLPAHDGDRIDDLASHAPPDVPVVLGPAGAHGAHALHAAAERHRAELLVVDPQTAAGVAHHAPCAIAVAPAGWADDAPPEPRQVVAAWDGSPESAEALEWAVQLVERTAGELRIVHVHDHAGIDRVAPPEIRARLEEMRAAAADRVPATADLRTGDPVAELTTGLGEADLLVMGTRARSPLLRVALGSVAGGVLRGAPCPVVVLPRGVHAPVETTV